MKKLWKRSEDVRAASLRIMKAALLIAVAIVSGCLIIAYAGETIIGLGLWLLHLAVMVAIGAAVGSIAYAVAVKMASLLTESTKLKKAANVIYPFGNIKWTDLETE